MSTVTLDDAVTTGRIYWTLAEAIAHIKSKFGARYRAWEDDASPDDQKRSLISAADFIDQQSWIEAYDTFAERDALEAFQKASCELAVMAYEDEDVLTAADQGTNVSGVFAGGAGVDFFNPTSPRGGTASVLPPVLMALIGQYLATSATAGADGGSGETGSCHNPFDNCSDYDRNRPF